MGRRLSFFFLIAFIAACSKKAETPKQAFEVEPKSVQLIGIVPSEQLDTCRSEIGAAGAKVLYEGGSGLLMLDREVKLKNCDVKFQQNQKINFESADPKVDLPTLLRLLPAEEIGARSFIANNPDSDGRGVT